MRSGPVRFVNPFDSKPRSLTQKQTKNQAEVRGMIPETNLYFKSQKQQGLKTGNH